MLEEKYGAIGKQIHDANVVATMPTYSVPVLLTHSVADFARHGELISLRSLE